MHRVNAGVIAGYERVIATLVGVLVAGVLIYWAHRGKSTKKRTRHQNLLQETSLTMSVVGIDFGNLNTVVAVARNRGIDGISNP